MALQVLALLIFCGHILWRHAVLKCSYIRSVSFEHFSFLYSGPHLQRTSTLRGC